MNLEAIGLENLPNCHFRRIKVTEIATQLSIAGEVVVFDDEEGYWSSSDLLKSYLKISLSLRFGAPDGGVVGSIAIDDFEPNKSIPFFFDTTYGATSEERNYYVASRVYLDINKLKQDYNEHDFNFGEEIEQWYRGPMFVEQIWKNGEPNNVYYTFKKDGEDYLGTIHTHEDTNMQGSRHRQNSHATLQRTESVDGSPKLSYLQQQNFNPRELSSAAMLPIPQTAKLSLYHARKLTAPQSFESSFFLFYHLEGLCLNSNQASRNYYQTNPSIFKNFEDIVTIQNIKVKKISGLFGNSELLIDFDPKDPSTYDKDHDMKRKTEVIRGPVFGQQGELKSFQVRHHFERTEKPFKYEIEINYINNLTKYIKDSLKKLINFSNQLSVYKNNLYWENEGQILRPQSFVNLNIARGYDVSYNEQTGVYTHNESANSTQQKEAFWIEAPAIYKSIESLISYVEPTNTNATSLFNLINPVSATRDTISEAVDAIDNLINICASKYDIVLGTSQSQLSVSNSNQQIRKFTLQINDYGHFNLQIKPLYTLIDDRDTEVIGLPLTSIEPEEYGDTERPEYSPPVTEIGNFYDSSFTISEQPSVDVVDYLDPSRKGQYDGGTTLNPPMEKKYGLIKTATGVVTSDKFFTPNLEVAKENLEKIVDPSFVPYVVEVEDYLGTENLPEESIEMFMSEYLKRVKIVSMGEYNLSTPKKDVLLGGPNPPLSMGTIGEIGGSESPFASSGFFVAGSQGSQNLIDTLTSTSPSDVREFLGTLTLFQFTEGETPTEIVNTDLLNPVITLIPAESEDELTTDVFLTNEIFNLLPKPDSYNMIATNIRAQLEQIESEAETDEAVNILSSIIYNSFINTPIITYGYIDDEYSSEIQWSAENSNNQLLIFRSETISGKVLFGIKEE